MKKILVVIFLGITIFISNNTLFRNNMDMQESLLKKDIDNTISVFLESDNGEYINSSNIPEKNGDYKFLKAVCKNDIEATWDEEFWVLKIASGIANARCSLYFGLSDKTASGIILANKTISTRSDFSTIITEDTSGIVYSAEDDDGTSYYFAGAPTDNWVKFAGFYWRIIRINGDKSIRMIYQGTSATATGENTQIGSSAFNESVDNNAYVGYMYTSGSVHGLKTESKIKTVLDTWYSNNLSSYASYIDTTAGFCNDRGPSTSSTTINGNGGTGTTATYYAAYVRLLSEVSPSFKCNNSSDLFTLNSSNKGNKVLSKPIGLITADEVIYAGGHGSTSNTSYYLYNGQYYWTMTPAWAFTSWDMAGMFDVANSGNLVAWNLSNAYGVRPVINLRADVTLTGSGTSSEPYMVS